MCKNRFHRWQIYKMNMIKIPSFLFPNFLYTNTVLFSSVLIIFNLKIWFIFNLQSSFYSLKREQSFISKILWISLAIFLLNYKQAILKISI